MELVELLDGRYKWVILCENCLRKVPEELVDGFYAAMLGPRDSEFGVLCCVPWTFRNTMIKNERFICDHCGTGVAVANSSKWFIERHKAERG